MSERPLLFSGIQPTGHIHLGNWLGAVRNWVRLTETHDCLYCIVDYHALTVPYDPPTLQERILSAAAMLMACGLGPGRGLLFVQSDVPEHTELAWLLSTVTPFGDLARMTQFKDKSSDHPENVNAGLFIYPVLQTADIVLYKAGWVPVGEDQRQHLEVAREIVRHFNHRFGETFPEPQMLPGEAPKVLGSDGVRKMSKSLDNHVALEDTAEATRKRIAGFFTDPQRKRRRDPGDPARCNIYALHAHFTPEARREAIDRDCRSAEIGCVDCKAELADGIERAIGPVRARFAALSADPGPVRAYLADSAREARRRARLTLEEVRARMGLRSRPVPGGETLA